MTRTPRSHRSAVLSALPLMLLAAACAKPPSTESKWSKGAGAPESFTVKEGAASIQLPAGHVDFAAYMVAAGSVGSYLTGEGEGRLMSPPQPRKGSPCTVTDKAAVFVFPNEGGFAPMYIAYLAVDGLIGCVDKQFSYASM